MDNVIGNYIIAWEDQDLGDMDYNDLVLEVSGVQTAIPEPVTILLMGSGLIGLTVIGRKKFFQR